MRRSDVVRGFGQLIFDAVDGTTAIVEAMHATIAAAPPPFGKSRARTRGPTRLVYQSVRLMNGMVRGGVDPLLRLLDTGAPRSRGRWDVVAGVTNGILGDHLVATRNPLAITMELRHDGRLLPLDERMSTALPRATGKLLVLVHGLCMSDRLWSRRGHDHGAALARDLGYTPLRILYNTGRHVSENGRELSAVLDALVRHWPKPIEELTIVAHSMGGLVARSAFHYGSKGSLAWPDTLRHMVFLGTPHHGAPLERAGNRFQSLFAVSAYTSPLSRLGMIRSAGVTDLRYGNLLDEDWRGTERFAAGRDGRSPVPLPEKVACYAVAGSLGERRGDLRDRILGDGLVPVASALGEHRRAEKVLTFPESHRWVAYRTGHLDLLSQPEVYAKLNGWLAER